jgi:hypothetical protein
MSATPTDGWRRFSARHVLDAQRNYRSNSLTGVLLLGPRGLIAPVFRYFHPRTIQPLDQTASSF